MCYSLVSISEIKIQNGRASWEPGLLHAGLHGLASSFNTFSSQFHTLPCPCPSLSLLQSEEDVFLIAVAYFSSLIPPWDKSVIVAMTINISSLGSSSGFQLFFLQAHSILCSPTSSWWCLLWRVYISLLSLHLAGPASFVVLWVFPEARQQLFLSSLRSGCRSGL